MIVTCKKEIPFRWIFFAVLPWAAFSFNWGVVGVAFLFSLKKFIENPAGLTFILSMPSFISVVTAPTVGFVSDRIWTRFGRRKPFIIISWTGIITSLVLMPLMPNFWSLLVVYLFYNLSTDLNSALDPLKQEIIPPHERGRAVGMVSWFSNLGWMSFYFIAFGRFDDVRYMGGSLFAGEKALYWSAALLIAVMLCMITLGIKELDPKSALRGQPLTPKNFFTGVFTAELRPIYLLVLGAASLGAGLGPLGNLLYIDQWGYTKQQMGINMAVGGVINLFIIGLLTVFADKLNRMKAYKILIFISLSINISYYCYVNFVLPDKHPSLVEIIFFGETGSIVGLLTGMVYVPLVYDYVRRNRMGTFAAGSGLVGRLTGIITLNGVGLFVWGYATLFLPPAGEMTRVVLREETSRTDLLAALRSAPWVLPSDGSAAPARDLDAKAWQANGTASERGRTWEIRLHDKESEKRSERKKDLSSKQSLLVSSEELLAAKVASATRRGDPAAVGRLGKEVAAKRQEREKITAEIAAIDAELARRSEAFHAQVEKVLGGRILAPGESLRRAALGEAVLVELPTTARPEGKALEKASAALRQAFPDLIDIRPLKLKETKEEENGYALVVSFPAGSGGGSDASLAEAVARTAAGAGSPLFPSGGGPLAPLGTWREPLLSFEAMVVENPVDPYVSPINRVVNGLFSLFQKNPTARRKLDAMASTLRSSSGIGHLRIDPGAEPKTLAVTVVLPPTLEGMIPTAGDAAVGTRLEQLPPAGAAKAGIAAEARQFYDQLEVAAAAQRITLVRPRLASGYAPMQYDYMSGYLWMFLMSVIGITMVFVFCHVERKGLVRKRGVEEEKA